MRTIDTKFCVRSIERQQSILAASGGAMQALLHRGREAKLELSQLTLIHPLGQCRTSQFATQTSDLRLVKCAIPESVHLALTSVSPIGEV